MIEWLAIAGRIFMGLVVFALGLVLAKFVAGRIPVWGLKRAGLWNQAVRLGLVVLASVIAWQIPTITTFLPSPQAEVASALNYQKNVSLGQRNVAIGGGGYVTGIYLHPRQQNLVYIRTDIGGFYCWQPTEQRWVPLTEHFSREQSNYYGGEALALDPNDPKIVYIAAGKYLKKPGALFKSTDQGATWSKLDLELPMGGNEADGNRWAGERLAINPFNSQMIFFGSRQDGLWQSLDGGESWTHVAAFLSKPKAGVGIGAIAFHPRIPGLVYSLAYGDGIYESTDTGVTWHKLAGSPSEAHRIAIASNDVLYVTHTSGVSRYTAQTWRNITPLGNPEPFNALSVNPTNPQDVLVCTRVTKSTKTYRSPDGGATWTLLKRQMRSTVPWWSNHMFSTPAVSAIEFDPHVPGRVWLTDWYGIWRTEAIKARRAVWTNYQNGHEEVVTFALVSPPKGALLLSGVADQDGFYHDRGLDTYPSRKLGRNWLSSFQDTYSIAYSQSDPLKMVRVAGNHWHSYYRATVSKDGGRTWRELSKFPTDVMATRVAVSATEPDLFVVITSEDQPFRTTDGGASWHRVSGLPNGPQGPWYWSQPLVADPVDGLTFYYYAKGTLFRSGDGGSFFQVVNRSLPKEDWQTLQAVPGTRGELWLSLDKQGLWRSTDGGETFSPLPKVERAYLFAFGKPQPGSTTPALYLYGEIAGRGEGIFRSLDQGGTWTSLGDRAKLIGNQPNTMAASWQEFGLVFVGTNGRGIYYGTF